MTKEIWKDIEGYEGLYQVSDSGRVKSLNYKSTGKKVCLKQQKNNKGYLLVSLYKDGERKFYLVHRLVAQAFVPNLEGYQVVNHKDENPLNNCANNLEWCTQKYNCNYGARNEKASKSNGTPVICVETNTIYLSARDAQRKTGIFATNICDCIRHKKRHYTAGGFHWKFV